MKEHRHNTGGNARAKHTEFRITAQRPSNTEQEIRRTARKPSNVGAIGTGGLAGSDVEPREEAEGNEELAEVAGVRVLTMANTGDTRVQEAMADAPCEEEV